MEPSVSKKVDKLEFGLMSPKFIKDMASAKLYECWYQEHARDFDELEEEADS